MSAPPLPRIWFDVQDLLDYVAIASRPSGIQRVCMEIYAALDALAPGRVGFVRHDPLGGQLRCITWPEVVAHCAPLQSPEALELAGETEPGALALPPTERPRGPARRALRWLLWRLPPELRHPMGEAIYAQMTALRAARRAVGAILSRRTAIPSMAPGREAGAALREVARPGDVIAAFGSPWSHPDYVAFLDRAARPAGVRFAMLVHDMIAFRRPEFVDIGNGLLFRRFMQRALPQADLLLAMSHATANDVRDWAERHGARLRTAPHAIPVGTGFGTPSAAASLPAGLTAGAYVLFVSTLEVRKNHLLAFRAWRRLLDEMPKGQVPQLVFAGSGGWGTADLMQMIRNSHQLGGKLTLVEKPDDATLAALYQGARFTLFPSHYEGWGLPVTESLSFGKVCLASGSSSVPEAGGAFCLYHDPDSITDAVALYRRAIEEPGLITGLEARIANEFRGTSWHASAHAVLDAIGRLS
jgi:glycosyltransferase involved in cell wall biosynthesis